MYSTRLCHCSGVGRPYEVVTKECLFAASHRALVKCIVCTIRVGSRSSVAVPTASVSVSPALYDDNGRLIIGTGVDSHIINRLRPRSICNYVHNGYLCSSLVCQDLARLYHPLCTFKGSRVDCEREIRSIRAGRHFLITRSSGAILARLLRPTLYDTLPLLRGVLLSFACLLF